MSSEEAVTPKRASKYSGSVKYGTPCQAAGQEQAYVRGQGREGEGW